MLLPINATNLVLVVNFIDPSTNEPILGIAHDTVDFSIEYLKFGANGFQTLALNPGTLGSYVANSFIEIDGGAYQFCPSNAILSGNGYPTWLRVTLPSGLVINGILMPSGFPSGNNAILSNILTAVNNVATGGDLTFSFNIPGFEPVTASGGSVYVKEQDRTLEFTANVDLTAYTLELVFENADGTDILVVQEADFTKSGNTITFTIPDSFTDTVSSYIWGIRDVSNQHFYGSGSFSVVYAPHKDSL